jgi:hypothetical protein
LCFGRSFDHMLGVKAGTNPAINGCPPSNSAAYCSNPVDPTNSSSPRIHTDNQAVYVQPADPNHSVPDTAEQMFGNTTNPPDGMTPLMDGFVFNCESRFELLVCEGGFQVWFEFCCSWLCVIDAKVNTPSNGGGGFIMKCFDPTHVPVM